MLLNKVDQVSITILVDNYTVILLASSDNVQRPPIINKKNKGMLIPIAEQGFASLIEISMLRAVGQTNSGLTQI